MTPELLHHPDPAQLSSITSTAEILGLQSGFGGGGGASVVRPDGYKLQQYYVSP